METTVKQCWARSELTQRELANIVGTSEGHICRILNGVVPRMKLAREIASALNATIEELWPEDK